MTNNLDNLRPGVKKVGFTPSKFILNPPRHHITTPMKVELLQMLYSNPFTGLESIAPYTNDQPRETVLRKLKVSLESEVRILMTTLRGYKVKDIVDVHILKLRWRTLNLRRSLPQVELARRRQIMALE